MMIRTGLVRLAAGVLLVCALTARALAAPPAPGDASGGGSTAVEQANCVYDRMTDEEVMLMVSTYLDRNATEKQSVEKAIAAAYRTCAAKYGWKSDRSDLAGEITLQAAVIDVVMQGMVDAGLKDDDTVLEIWNKLAEADVNRVLDDGWEKDAQLVARLRKALLDGGVPDTGDMLKNGVVVLVAASREGAAMDEWLHGDKSKR